MAVKKAAKKKIKKASPTGRCYVQAGFGNTLVTITDVNGDTVCWSSAGALGFKGSRKGTPFAAQMTAEDAAKKATEAGVRSVDVFDRPRSRARACHPRGGQCGTKGEFHERYHSNSAQWMSSTKKTSYLTAY